MGTYYDILGVEPTASKEAISKSYKKKVDTPPPPPRPPNEADERRGQALKCHPDRHPDEEKDEALAEFKALAEAYDALKDDGSRARYDSHLASQKNPPSPQRTRPAGRPRVPSDPSPQPTTSTPRPTDRTRSGTTPSQPQPGYRRQDPPPQPGSSRRPRSWSIPAHSFPPNPTRPSSTRPPPNTTTSSPTSGRNLHNHFFQDGPGHRPPDFLRDPLAHPPPSGPGSFFKDGVHHPPLHPNVQISVNHLRPSPSSPTTTSSASPTTGSSRPGSPTRPRPSQRDRDQARLVLVERSLESAVARHADAVETQRARVKALEEVEREYERVGRKRREARIAVEVAKRKVEEAKGGIEGAKREVEGVAAGRRSMP